MNQSLFLIFCFLLIVLLAAITWIDARRQIIPDVLNLALAAAGLAQPFLLGRPSLVNALGAGVGGYCAAWLLRHVYVRLRGYHGLGLGDAKFIGASGLWIGLEGLPWMMLAATLSGLTWVAARSIWTGQFEAQQRLSFGPHLCFGLLAAWCAAAFAIV